MFWGIFFLKIYYTILLILNSRSRYLFGKYLKIKYAYVTLSELSYIKMVLQFRIVHITFAELAKIPHLLSQENLQKICKITGQAINFHPSSHSFHFASTHLFYCHWVFPLLSLLRHFEGQVNYQITQTLSAYPLLSFILNSCYMTSYREKHPTIASRLDFLVFVALSLPQLPLP